MWRFLFGPRDLSRDWVRSAGLRLNFSLESATLNSARLGDPLDAIAFLGRADDRRQARYGAFCYHTLGIYVECDSSNRISEIDVVYWDEDEEFQAYAGKITYQGREIELQGRTKDDFLDRFGECYWQHGDELETILFYEFQDLEWLIEFDEHDVIKRISVGNQPLMADATQRKNFGVTKPWPPQR